jgi:hypothetical protein
VTRSARVPRRPRLRIMAWPQACGYCGSRFTWRGELPGGAGYALGCVPGKTPAEALRAFRMLAGR